MSVYVCCDKQHLRAMQMPFNESNTFCMSCGMNWNYYDGKVSQHRLSTDPFLKLLHSARQYEA